MQNIFYQPPGVWFGDCMPFGLHDTFYLSISAIPEILPRSVSPLDGIFLPQKILYIMKTTGLRFHAAPMKSKISLFLRAACSCKTTAPTVFLHRLQPRLPHSRQAIASAFTSCEQRRPPLGKSERSGGASAPARLRSR